MLHALLRGLLAEGWADSHTSIPEDAASQRHLLRTLINLRPALPAHPDLIELQDRFLAAERASSAVTDPQGLPTIREAFGVGAVPFRDLLVLWQGDITTLAADAIVNAANSRQLGCFGLNYQDPELFRQWYPQFARLGLNNIWEAIVAHWAPNDQNRRRFWAFWAHHIQMIRFDAPPGAPYFQLARLVAGKPHFVITTNVDAQFAKAGFSPSVVFAPQGDYGKFQCATPCNHTLHDNRDLVRSLIANTDAANVLVCDSGIPRCPARGDYLERNLRRDGRFEESPHMERQPAYVEFVNRSFTGRLVLLELGAGFNTPGIIRWPFERIAQEHPSARLVRVNLQDARVPGSIADRSLAFPEDLARVLGDLAQPGG